MCNYYNVSPGDNHSFIILLVHLEVSFVAEKLGKIIRIITKNWNLKICFLKVIIVSLFEIIL